MNERFAALTISWSISTALQRRGRSGVVVIAVGLLLGCGGRTSSNFGAVDRGAAAGAGAVDGRGAVAGAAATEAAGSGGRAGTATCGDGFVGGTEVCDGVAGLAVDCSDFDFDVGVVGCTSHCTYDAARCEYSFVGVETSNEHTCGLKTDGTIVCWGSNHFGQAAPEPGTYSQVSTGYRHTCGVKSDGTLACRGHDNFGDATPPSGTFSQVSVIGRDNPLESGQAALAGWLATGRVASDDPRSAPQKVRARSHQLRALGRREWTRST